MNDARVFKTGWQSWGWIRIHQFFLLHDLVTGCWSWWKGALRDSARLRTCLGSTVKWRCSGINSNNRRGTNFLLKCPTVGYHILGEHRWKSCKNPCRHGWRFHVWIFGVSRVWRFRWFKRNTHFRVGCQHLLEVCSVFFVSDCFDPAWR